MIITNELRAALRSAAVAQRNASRANHVNEYDVHSKLIEDFLKAHPAVAKQVREASGRLVEAEEIKQQADAVLARLGFGRNQNFIHDPKAFCKAGGRFPVEKNKRWDFDQVMAELARATPVEGARILKRLGIIWG